MLRSRQLWLGLLSLEATVIAYLRAPWMTADSLVYVALGNSIVHGKYGTDFPDVLRPPGYPLVVAAFHWAPPTVLIALQLLLVVISLSLLDRFLAARGSDPLLFRLLSLLYPLPLLYAAAIMTEGWTTFFVTAAAFLLCVTDLTILQLAIAGVAIGLAALMRTDLILLPIFVGAALLWRRVSLGRALLPLLCSGLVLLPYALWNNANYSIMSPAPLASAAGNSLYLATWQAELPAKDIQSIYSAPTKAAFNSGLVAEIASINRKLGAPATVAPFNPAVYSTRAQQMASSPVAAQYAIKRIKNDPAHYVGHLFTNLFTLWNSSASTIPRLAAPPLLIISALMWLFGWFGVTASIRDRSLAPAIACMVYATAVHLPLHSEARYTASFRVLLIMFSAVGIRAFSTWISAGRREKSGHDDPAFAGEQSG
jgi:hypothetical protein